MALIKGETVTLEHHVASTDSRGYTTSGSPVLEEVDNVLFEQRRTGSSIDASGDSLDSVTTNVTFHFPKTYTGALTPEDIIVYHGNKYRIFMVPEPFQNSPLDWNRQVDAKSFDG